MLVVVSDSSPLIYLTRLAQLPLLQALHNTVFVPQAVWDEVVIGGAGLPESLALSEAVAIGWICVKAPQQGAASLLAISERLGRADVEAILLAQELGALLLTDDSEVRELAESMAVKVGGTIGLLVRGKREGMIERVRPLLDTLRTQTNFRMSERLYELALSDAGEA